MVLTTVFVFWKVIFKKLFLKLFYVCLLLEKSINEKYFSVKKNFDLIFKKVYIFFLNRKHVRKIMKNAFYVWNGLWAHLFL